MPVEEDVALVLTVAVGEIAVLPLALSESVVLALGENVVEALGVDSRGVWLPQALGLVLWRGLKVREGDTVAVARREGEKEVLTLEERLGSCASPAARQADWAMWAALQGLQEVAPWTALYVPGAHSTGEALEPSQKEPAGHITGVMAPCGHV